MDYAFVRHVDHPVEILFIDGCPDIIPCIPDDLHVIIRHVPEQCSSEYQFLAPYVLGIGPVELEHREEELTVELLQQVAFRLLGDLQNLDSIVGSGNRYLTRVKLNKSDDKRMSECGDEWEYVEDGVCCLRHTFDSSGRTNYLYFSIDNWMRSFHTAERNVNRMVSAIRSYEDGHFRTSDFVTVRKNVLADIEVKVSMQTHIDFDDPDEIHGLICEVMGSRAGIFKLESSEQLTAFEALDRYRSRATVEHLIHSLKRVTGLKPLRVWKESSIRGAMLLALLAETAISMARYEIGHESVTIVKNGRKQVHEARPSTESMVWSLSHLTVTRLIVDGMRKKAYFSNWNEVSSKVLANIHADLGKTSPIPA